jgi:hypothetical protein
LRGKIGFLGGEKETRGVGKETFLRYKVISQSAPYVFRAQKYTIESLFQVKDAF